MENPFKYIDQPLVEVPQGLKVKVMSDIAMAKLIMELAPLSSYNVGAVIETVIRTSKTKN